MKSIHIELDEYVMAGIGIIAGLLLLVFPQQSLNAVSYTHLIVINSFDQRR